MKITQYFGFDFLRGYEFTNNYTGRLFKLDGIGRLNILMLPLGGSSSGDKDVRIGWIPELSENEWWLRAISGGYFSNQNSHNISITNYARQACLSFKTTDMFFEALEDTNVNSYGMAFRFQVTPHSRGASYGQSIVLCITKFPYDTRYAVNRWELILSSEISTVVGDSQHVEVIVDFDRRIARRWVDGNELPPLALPDTLTEEEFKNGYFTVGERYYSTGFGSHAEWAIKDIVFHVSDEHTSGVLHRNIGLVKIKEVDSTVVESNGWTFEDPTATFDDFFSDLLWTPVVTPSSLLSPPIPTNLVMESNTEIHELDELVAVGVNVFAHRKPGEYVRPLRCTATNENGEMFSELCDLGLRVAPLGAGHTNTFIRTTDRNYDRITLTLSLEE
jgi:hypothetical protein